MASFDEYLASLSDPAALAGFDLSNGTVRFTPDRPIPDAALEQLLRHRLVEIEGAS